MNFVSSNAKKVKSCTGSYIFLHKVALTNRILAIVHKHIEDLVRELFVVDILKKSSIVVSLQLFIVGNEPELSFQDINKVSDTLVIFAGWW